jgi:hypothetical protein
VGESWRLDGVGDSMVNHVTQPLFGDIARSEANRRSFAKNVLNFLNAYGYDGTFRLITPQSFQSSF